MPFTASEATFHLLCAFLLESFIKGSEMKRLIILLLISMGFLFAAEKTFIREYTYQASDYDSKVTSRANALEQVKTILLEEVTIFFQSEFEMKDWEEQIGDNIESVEFVEQIILAIMAGVN